jgi:hypothetical protein
MKGRKLLGYHQAKEKRLVFCRWTGPYEGKQMRLKAAGLGFSPVVPPKQIIKRQGNTIRIYTKEEMRSNDTSLRLKRFRKIFTRYDLHAVLFA